MISESKVLEIVETICWCLDDENIEVREMAATYVWQYTDTVSISEWSRIAEHYLASLGCLPGIVSFD